MANAGGRFCFQMPHSTLLPLDHRPAFRNCVRSNADANGVLPFFGLIVVDFVCADSEPIRVSDAAKSGKRVVRMKFLRAKEALA